MVQKVISAEDKIREVIVKNFEDVFKAANPADQRVVDANITSMLEELHGRGASTQFIDKALDKMMFDHIPALKEMAVNRKDNALTPSVDNYAPADGHTRLDAGASFQPSAGSSNYNLNVNHGFDASAIGLTRLAAHASADIDHEGQLVGSAGFTAVKAFADSLQPNDATLFLATGADVHINAKEVSGTVTGLVVAASEWEGVPVGTYIGGVYDIKTGDVTKVVQGEAMLSANTDHPTTLGAGAATKDFSADTTSVNFTAYQKYKDYYAGLVVNTPVNNVEDTSVNLKLGMQF